MANTTPGAVRYRGTVVYLFAYDVAYDMKRETIPTLLGQPVTPFAVDASKRSPKMPSFFRSLSVRLPDLEMPSSRGTVRMTRNVKILPVGAISIAVSIPFAVSSLQELVSFHNLTVGENRPLQEEVLKWAYEVRNDLTPHLIRPPEKISDDEAYTVFCFDAPVLNADGSALSGEDFLEANRRDLAALLTEEPSPGLLSDQETLETTSKSLSYYDQDLIVIDWDAAIIIDEPRYRDEILYAMELANLQLAELEAYDRLLDGAVETSYRDMRDMGGGHKRRLASITTQRQLQELRVDMARITDALSNITKFSGDWHLARVYQAVSARFHLADWHKAVDEKLKTLDDLYQLIRADQNNRLMLVLEITVVVLFVIDVVIIIWK